MNPHSSALLIRVGISLPPITLSSLQVPITVGRGEDNSIVLDDPAASRTHAIIDRKGENWILTDVSLNGTQVTSPGQASVTLKGIARRVQHEDVLVFGSTAYHFSHLGNKGAADADDRTPPLAPKVAVTPRQLDVLMALSEPLRNGRDEAPASNLEIGEALFLSHDAVRGHLSELYRAFEVDGGTQVQRRMRLASQWLRAEAKGQRG